MQQSKLDVGLDSKEGRRLSRTSGPSARFGSFVRRVWFPVSGNNAFRDRVFFQNMQSTLPAGVLLQEKAPNHDEDEEKLVAW